MNRYLKLEPRNIRLDTVTRIMPIIMKEMPITSYDLSAIRQPSNFKYGYFINRKVAMTSPCTYTQ